MIPWTNFGYLVLVQFVIVLALLLCRRVPLRRAAYLLACSAVLGLVLGICFDLLIDKYDRVFVYYPVANRIAFYMANGLLSYGLTVATAWLVPGDFPREPRPFARLWSGAMVAAGGLTLLLLPTHRMSALAVMFSSGLLMLAISEATAAWCAREGLLLAAIRGRPYQALRLWGCCVAVGAIYEIADWQFPVWRWQPLPGWPPLAREALIVLAGYLVLFYPMVVATRLLRTRSDLVL